MALLFQSYAETPFRQFANELLATLINTMLLNVSKRANPSGLRPTSRFPCYPARDVPASTEAVCHVLRYWSWHVALSADVLSEWADLWLTHGLTRLPRADFRCDWIQWDTLMTHWLKVAYLAFIQGEWEVAELNDAQWAQLWNRLGAAYFAAQSPPLDIQDFAGQIAALATTLPKTWETLTQIWRVLSEFGQRVGLSTPIVPDWAMDGGWSSPQQEAEEPIGWDWSMHAVGEVLGRSFTTENVRKWILQEWNTLAKIWIDAVEDMQGRERRDFRFWFPVIDRQMLPPQAVTVSSNARMIGLSEEDARRLNGASGFGPRPEHHPDDLVIQVDTDGPYLEAAMGQARSTLEEIRALLLVADPSSRWEVGAFVYHETLAGPTDFNMDSFDSLMAMRRDNHQLAGPVDPDKLAQFFGWAENLKSESDALPKALAVAMQWQGIARDQDNPENGYLCNWIALERLSDGSYHVEDLVSGLGAFYWHPGWYVIDDADSCARLYSAERDRLQKLVHALKTLRNRDVAHRGLFRHQQDERYASWLLAHLVNDLTKLFIGWIDNEGLRTFEDLRNRYGVAYAEQESRDSKAAHTNNFHA